MFLFKGGTKRGAKAVIVRAGGCLPPSLKNTKLLCGRVFCLHGLYNTLNTLNTQYCNNTLSIYFMNVKIKYCNLLPLILSSDVM
jgi:hypothetical protein